MTFMNSNLISKVMKQFKKKAYSQNLKRESIQGKQARGAYRCVYAAKERMSDRMGEWKKETERERETQKMRDIERYTQILIHAQ